MAISTRTINDSINWAKRFTFNRNPVIGNSLEPALTCANLVMQTILGPPFECNRALGLLKDSAETLQRLARYLLA